MLTLLDPKRRDPIECDHRASVTVHRNERGQVWVECEACGLRGIAYPERPPHTRHSVETEAAASFWAWDAAVCDRAYRHQRRTADNPTTMQAMLYWRKRRGSGGNEGA